MFLSWLQNRRRRQWLETPVPQEWLAVLQRNVPLFTRLSAAEQAKLLNFLRIFIPEKNWEGCRGFAITSEVQVTIAAQAAVLVLGFEEEYFDRVTSILVYPDTYMAAGKMMLAPGVIMEGPSYREGEAWYRGPIVLAWPEVLAGGRQASHGNLVYHEFAHQLDMLNGSIVDGIPPMPSREIEHWEQIMESHFRQLMQACAMGHHTLLDCYGATSRAEFFAVATETFFTRPIALQQHHPALYEAFRHWYRQDPAQREHAS